MVSKLFYLAWYNIQNPLICTYDIIQWYHDPFEFQGLFDFIGNVPLGPCESNYVPWLRLLVESCDMRIRLYLESHRSLNLDIDQGPGEQGDTSTLSFQNCLASLGQPKWGGLVQWILSLWTSLSDFVVHWIFTACWTWVSFCKDFVAD